jgi:hypothetical protein
MVPRGTDVIVVVAAMVVMVDGLGNLSAQVSPAAVGVGEEPRVLRRHPGLIVALSCTGDGDGQIWRDKKENLRWRDHPKFRTAERRLVTPPCVADDRNRRRIKRQMAEFLPQVW